MRKIKMSWMLIAALLLLAGGAVAQSFSPQAGDKSVALRFGRAVSFGDLSFYEVNRSVNYSPSGTLPSLNEASSIEFSTENSMANMVGVEFKYFITSQIAARFSGSGAIAGSPSQDAVEGVNDPTGEYYPGTYLQGWRMFEGRTTKQLYIDLGADYYFASNYSRVNPYGGVQFNSSYGQLELFDGYRGLDGNDEVIPTYDTRRGEAYALGGSIVGGIDYYLAEGLILGIEIKAINYMYEAKRIFHQSGMDAQDADTHNTAFLSQPVIKLGFRF
jgi:outer membrane protein W